MSDEDESSTTTGKQKPYVIDEPDGDSNDHTLLTQFGRSSRERKRLY